MRNNFLISCLLVGVFFIPPAFAKKRTFGVVRLSKVNVRAKPTTQSKILVTLKRNRKVRVLSRKGSWLKVKIALKGGFDFSGWVIARAIRIRGSSSRRTVRSRPKRVPAQSSRIDEFFEPPKSSRSTSSRRTLPRRSVRSRKGSGWGLTDRLTLTGGSGFLMYVYELNTGGASPGEVFSYNLSGVGINFAADYKFFQGFNDRLLASANLFYQHGFFIFDTALKDTSGSTFDTRSSKSATDEIVFKVVGKYRLSSRKKSLYLGSSLGYQFFRFNGDDVVDGSGNNINLFVDQTTQSVPIGVFGGYSFGGTEISAGCDVLLLNSTSESPSGASGTDPKGQLGFSPYTNVNFGVIGHHYLNLGYRLRFQKYSFSGTASRVNANNLTDGSASTILHQLLATYEYRF